MPEGREVGNGNGTGKGNGNGRTVWLDAIRVLAICLIVGFHFLFAFTSDENLRIWGFYGVSLSSSWPADSH